MHVLGGPTGTQDMVDLRGFGAFAQSNVLILVNGRRFQDFDLQGFDFSAIPLNSIERIEITRGNSGAVLYGDGAIGGVINIVTKSSATQPIEARVEGARRLLRLSRRAAYPPAARRAHGRVRVQQLGRLRPAIGRTASSSSQCHHQAELQRRRDGAAMSISPSTASIRIFPAGLPNLPLVYPITLADPRASVTPFDWAQQEGHERHGRHSPTRWRRASI